MAEVEKYANDKVNKNASFDIVDYPLLDFTKTISKDEMMIFNFDEYTQEVSPATLPPVYEYSDGKRKTSNAIFVDVSSDCIPKSNLKKDFYVGLQYIDKLYVPLDYLRITRSDGTHVLLAENIEERYVSDGSKFAFLIKGLESDNSKVLKSYSIVRYSPRTRTFNETTVFSDGIDIARIKSMDNKYLNAVANGLLSEEHINESLLTPDAFARYSGTDDISYGAGYIGYVDATTLQVDSSMEINALRMLDQEIRNEGRSLEDKTILDTVADYAKASGKRFFDLFRQPDAPRTNVLKEGTTIPEDVYKKTSIGIKRDPLPELGEVDGSVSIPVEDTKENSIEKEEIDGSVGILVEDTKENSIEKEEIDIKQNDEVTKQKENIEKAEKAAISLGNLSRTLKDKQRGTIKPEPSEKPRNNDDKQI